MTNARSQSRVVYLGLLILLVGCDGIRGPAAPSGEVMEGVYIYQHANYLGGAQVAYNAPDLSRFEGPCVTATDNHNTSSSHDNWNDCISSVRVTPGWHVILYRDADYGGQSVELTRDTPNLQLAPGTCSHGGLDDCITSIQVLSPEEFTEAPCCVPGPL